jgi:glycerol-3-phosphate acyltransferase PlsY
VGSGNPGANNALRSGGLALAAAVLFVEFVKGSLAVVVGLAIADPTGALLAGLSAVAGNVYNVWYRFGGGKGLGITGGVLMAAWPTVLIPIGAFLGLATWLTRSTALGTLISIFAFNAMAIAWLVWELPVGWGPLDHRSLVVLAVGIGVLLFPKHLAALRRLHPASCRAPA